MVDFESKVVDGKKILIAFKELPRDLLDTVSDELYIGANDIRTRIIKGMQKTEKAPWFYLRRKKPNQKKHYPSAPGQFPAIDSGELISRVVADNRDSEIEVGIEAGAPYAVFLEEGTDKMEPRPFLQIATKVKMPKIQRNIMKAIAKAAGDAFK